MIYIFSNVEYPIENKIQANKEDLLVFINKANSISYYDDHQNKIIFHRRKKQEYGNIVPGVENYYVYGTDGIKKEFINNIPYDWEYDTPNNEAKTMTTGYIVIKYLEQKYPNEEITLVNFGFEVKKSTQRVVNHNWIFESKELGKYKKIYTAETFKDAPIEIVYCCDEKYIEKLRMSAKTVIKNNPCAHITVVSNSPLDIEYDNICFNTSQYNFIHVKNDRISDAAYLKLFLPEILSYDKIIFLDCDTICRGSLNELNEIDVNYIAVCHSHDAGIKQSKQIGVPLYGLAGFMVMNLKNLREMEFTKQALFAMENFMFPKTNWQHEETIINCCFYKYLKFIDTKWNFCYNR